MYSLLVQYAWSLSILTCKQRVDCFEWQTGCLREEEVDNRDRCEVNRSKDNVRFVPDVTDHDGNNLDNKECGKPLEDD